MPLHQTLDEGIVVELLWELPQTEVDEHDAILQRRVHHLEILVPLVLSFVSTIDSILIPHISDCVFANASVTNSFTFRRVSAHAVLSATTRS